MMGVLRILLIAIFLLASFIPVKSIGQENAKIDYAKIRENAESVASKATSSNGFCPLGDAVCNEAKNRDMESALRHAMWTRDFIQVSWQWHFVSTIFLFAIVLIIVLFGLFITYLQFHRDYMAEGQSVEKIDSKKVDFNTSSVTEGAEVSPPKTNRLKISREGLELSSQIIGLFVLAFSLIFFYVYVKDIYPIHEQELSVLKPPTDSVPNNSTQKGK
jgi:hypothetical protein